MIHKLGTLRPGQILEASLAIHIYAGGDAGVKICSSTCFLIDILASLLRSVRFLQLIKKAIAE